MTPPGQADPFDPGRLRFGDFELDAETGELTRQGEGVSLPPQAARLLVLLVERSGELVTREEIRTHLWPGDAHVEADLGINYAIRRIRLALADDAASPTYLETLPRRGYRFRAPVERLAATARAEDAALADARTTPAPMPRHAAAIALAVVATVAVALAVVIVPRREDAPAEPPRLAVFPLIADEDVRPLADGLGEDLSIALIRYFGDEIDVIAFSSSRVLGQEPKPRDVAGRLGADLQLTGRLSRSGDRLEVRLRLQDVDETEPLWTATYEVEREELVEARGDLARQVAAALGRNLPLPAPTAERGAVPATVYERYLQAVGLLHALPTNEAQLRVERARQVQRALDLLAECVAEAPEFADGWAALAEAWWWTHLWRAPEEWSPQVDAAAERALALDPTHATALAISADQALESHRDWVAADALSRRAVRHGGGMARTHRTRSMVVAAAGRMDESRHELAVARRLDPLDWYLSYLEASFSVVAGDFAEASRQLALLREAHPEDPALAAMALQMHALRGDPAAASAVADDYLRRKGRAGAEPATAADFWQGLHDHFASEQADDVVGPYWRALPLIGLGRHGEAAQLLRDAACGGPLAAGLTLIHVDPFFLRVADEPAYEEAVRCVGMPRHDAAGSRASPAGPDVDPGRGDLTRTPDSPAAIT